MTELRLRPTASRQDAESEPLFPLLPRRDPISALPVMILYPHSRCNCRCVMCDIWRAARREEITATEVSRWLPEWRALGVTRVVLSGGEPLMHSHLWDLCDVLRSADIGITLLSSGLLLVREAGRLVRYADDVIVSLDGPREIHDRIRDVPRAYERLADGVAAVRAADPTVRLTGRCTVQRLNFRALRATVRAAHDLGLHHVSFLAADVSTEAFNRPGGWEPPRVKHVTLDERDLPVLAAEIDALEAEHAAEFRTGFIAESPDKLRSRLHHYYRALLDRTDFPRNECNAPWVSTVIEADGTVRPCFFQPPLGNIRETRRLDAILNSDRAVAWRRGLDTNRNELCRRCVCTLSLRGQAATADRVDPAT